MKKEKEKLLISSIIMILYTLYAFLNLLRKGTLFTGIDFHSITNIIQLIITFIGCIYFIHLSNSNVDLKKCSKSIFFISIVFFLINIISGILGFMVYNNINPVKKRELPKLDDVKCYNKYICLIGLIICLTLLFYISGIVKGRIGVILIYLSIFLIMVFIYRKRLVRDFKEFKKYFREYNSLVLKTWGLSFLTLIIISLIIRLITKVENPTNQEALNDMFTKAPIFIAILTVFYAPISEELMFRGVFKEFIKNKYAFIIISGFLFGAVHVIDDFQSYGELLYIFLYASMGCYLAYLYQKTNNIFSNIYFHFLQNSLSVIIMFLTLLK